MIKVGIIGGAEIAYRMFVPAILKSKTATLVGIASNSHDKREKFKTQFNTQVFSKYEDLINCEDIDAVYIPLPPSLHHEFCKKALLAGKHVLLEKPATTCLVDTEELITISRNKELCIHENYMFQYHSQISEIKKIISDNTLGEIRLIRSNFQFPFRNNNDFRYSKAMGGGALMDVGGYVTKLASILLGDSIRVTTAMLNITPQFDVDLYGNVTYENNDGLVFQGSFGMDNIYQCSLEIHGNKAKLFTNRIFTAPQGFEPAIILETNNGAKTITLPSDSHFFNSIEVFSSACVDENKAEELRYGMLRQGRLIEDIIKSCFDKKQWGKI